MKRARRFCSPDEDGIFLGRYDKKQERFPSFAVVKIQQAWFLVRPINERKSLIEILYIFNSLRPIKRAFSYFGLTLKECIGENVKITIKVMQERCKEEIERVKQVGYTTTENISEWNWLLNRLNKNKKAPPELQRLLENTIKELEQIGVRDKPRKQKKKSKRR